MRKEIAIDDFHFLVSGRARQIGLMCHGGYQHKYGFVMVPARMRIHFYIEHGQRSRGGGIGGKVLQNADDAYNGWKPDVIWRTKEFLELEKILEDQNTPLNLKQMAWKQLHGLLSRALTSARDGVKYTVGADSKGRNKNFEIPIYNYGLSPDKTYGESLWENFKKGTDKKMKYSNDIDLMVLSKKPTKDRYLKDALQASAEANGGQPYEVFHYFPCRDMYDVQPYVPPKTIPLSYHMWVEPHLIQRTWNTLINFGMPVPFGHKFYSTAEAADLAAGKAWGQNCVPFIVNVLAEKQLFQEKGSTYVLKKSANIQRMNILSYKTKQGNNLVLGKVNGSARVFIE